MRTGFEYEEIARAVIQVYLDYDIMSFPLDLRKISQKMGVNLIPYSSCCIESKALLLKKSRKGFFVRGTHESSPSIYYNDYGKTEESIRYTIAHEIKHYIYNECYDNKDSDDLADFFARFFLCPIPYLIVKGIRVPKEIAYHCRVSLEAATNASSNINNRLSAFHFEIFDYEIPLLEHLIPDEYLQFRKDFYNPSTRRWL